MKSVVVTGGIACGKSYVHRGLAGLVQGAHGFCADDEVGRLLAEPTIIVRLQEVFGPSVTCQSGAVDRQWLRTRVLHDDKERRQLEAILHPPVLESLETARGRAREQGANLFLAEVPLHYEIGSKVLADLVIVVASSRAVQTRRLMDRRGLDESTIEQLLRAQWPIEAKVERADVVVWNDGGLPALDAQIKTLANKLSQG